MDIFKMTLPSYLGPALINADFSGLSNDEADNARAIIGKYGWPLDMGDEYIARFNGFVYNVADYTFCKGA